MYAGYDDITFTFPRLGQTEDWVKYLQPMPRLSELTLCYWIKPFKLPSGDLYPISYATSAHDNTFLMTVSEANRIKPQFKAAYTVNGVSFQENHQVRTICCWLIFG